jgi:ATP-binding cassette, subfamily B, bacterial
MRIWRLVAAQGRSHLGGMGALLGLMLAGLGIDVLKPWPMKFLVDDVLHKRLRPGLHWLRSLPGGGAWVGVAAWLAVATVILLVTSAAAATLLRYVQSGLGTRMSYRLAGQVFGHVQRLSLRYHATRGTGDAVRRITQDTGFVRDLLIGVVVPAVSALVSLGVMFEIMWHLDHALAGAAMLVALPLAAVIAVFSRPMASRAYAQQQAEGQIMSLTEQTLTAIPVVQAFGRESAGDRRFGQLAGQAIRAAVRSTIAQLWFKIGAGGVMAGGTAAVMMLGGLHVLNGRITLGTLLVFLSYLTSLYAPLETLAYLSGAVASATGSARRVLEVLDAPPEVTDGPRARRLPGRAEGAVRFEGVSFGYVPGQPVLRGVDLEVEPGHSVALVGHTGAGKSTLVSLIPRFFDPWSGVVSLDGHDVSDLTVDSLRSQISLVLQEPFLLPLSVAENIAYGRPEASMEEIRSAAQAANADVFIEQLPDGYDSLIGERGATLSGGERQRLAVARALLRDAPVLILDEPTSAVDAETEASLVEAFSRLIQGRTTLIIAHRLSTVRWADEILVVDEGRIVERGPHRHLVHAGGPYQRLHSLQFSDDHGLRVT